MSAGLIWGSDVHHLDHIAPLCSIMHMPLLVTEEETAQRARAFYPGVEVMCIDTLTLPEHLVSHFDTIFYSMPRDLFDEVFFLPQQLLQKKVHTIWCPHGNSDKGNTIFFMEALRKEEAALVYGKQMIEFLERKAAFKQLKGHVITGNYRYAYYEQNKSFYDSCVEREVTRRLPSLKRNILYAPTWQDYERSSSFFEAMPLLAEHIPPDVNLIVKLHPNLTLQHDFMVDDTIERFRSHPQILFLTDFPPVYSLLNVVDVYVGDMSSIGYDFLTFDRPLFFLNHNARDSAKDLGLYLFRCGIEIKKQDYAKIYKAIDDFFHFELRPFSEIRKEVYAYAFGHAKPFDVLKREIEEMIKSIAKEDMGFF